MKPPPAQRVGVTLMEVAISTALVGVVLVASLETLAGAVRAGRETSDQLMGQALADAMLAEVVALPYSDPDDDSSSLGLEADELSNANDRTQFDDLDDYDGWKQTPPEARDQTALDDYDDWTRRVDVDFVQFSSFGVGLGITNVDRGIKRIVVTVIDPSGVTTTREAIRSPDGPTEAPAPFAATRVSAIDVTLTLGEGSAVSRRVALTNLAEEP